MSTDSNTVPPRPRRHQTDLEKREADYLQSLSDPATRARAQAMLGARAEPTPAETRTASDSSMPMESEARAPLPKSHADSELHESQTSDPLEFRGIAPEQSDADLERRQRMEAPGKPEAQPSAPSRPPLSAEQQEKIDQLLAKAKRIREAPAIEWQSESQWEQEIRRRQQWVAGDVSFSSPGANTATRQPDAEGYVAPGQSSGDSFSQRKEAERLERLKPVWYAGDVHPYLKQKEDFEELSHTWHTGNGRLIKSKGPAAVIAAAAVLSLVGLAPIGFLVALATPIPWIVGAARQRYLADKIRDNVLESAKIVRDTTDAVPLRALETAVRHADVKSFDGQLSIQLFKERLEKMRAKNEPIPLSSRRLATGSRH